MQLFGLDPVSITIGICVIGVSYRIITGMIGKKKSEFSTSLMMSTFMLGIITSIGLIAPVIDAIPNDSDSLIVLSVVAGQIATIMGVDAAARKGYKISQNNISKKTSELKDVS